MITKEYDLEVVTPMFLAGADQNNAEIRAASIKGQLRWWWRAINGNLPLRDLKKREEDIFGSTNNKSSFSLQIFYDKLSPEHTNLPRGEMVVVKGKPFKASIIHYLAFGPVDRGRLKRPYINEGVIFSLKFIFYKNCEKEILDAFYFFINYGGIGSRSRNGFGSLKASINSGKNYNFKNINLSEYTSFSRESVVFKFKKHNTWGDALSEIGMAYREARLSLEPKHKYGKRVLVAMPIIQDRQTPNNIRHAKPFFLHVDKIGNSYQGKILYIPHNYFNPFFQTRKRLEYENTMKKMCDILEQKAREVSNEF